MPSEFPASIYLDHVWLGTGVRGWSSIRHSVHAAALWTLHSFITTPKGGFSDAQTLAKIQRPFPVYWVFGGIPHHVIRLLTKSRRGNTGVSTPSGGNNSGTRGTPQPIPAEPGLIEAPPPTAVVEPPPPAAPAAVVAKPMPANAKKVVSRVDTPRLL